MMIQNAGRDRNSAFRRIWLRLRGAMDESSGGKAGCPAREAPRARKQRGGYPRHALANKRLTVAMWPVKYMSAALMPLMLEWSRRKARVGADFEPGGGRESWSKSSGNPGAGSGDGPLRDKP